MGWVALDTNEIRDGVYYTAKKKRRPRSAAKPRERFQSRHTVLDRSKLLPVDRHKGSSKEADDAAKAATQVSAFAEQVRTRQPRRKERKRDTGMKLMVEVRVKAKSDVGVTELSFPFSIGEGQQSVKWVGMAASQRFQNRQPHGAPRGRELVKLGAGFLLPGEVMKVGLPLFGKGGRLEPLLNMLMTVGVPADRLLFVGSREKWATDMGSSLFPAKFLYRLGKEQQRKLNGESAISSAFESEEDTAVDYLSGGRFLIWDQVPSEVQEQALSKALEGNDANHVVVTGQSNADIDTVHAMLAKCNGGGGTSAIDFTMDDELLKEDPEQKFVDLLLNDGAESMSTVVIAFDCSAVHETRLEPGSRLCECLADGDGLVVQLAAVLDGCFTAELEVEDNLPDFKRFNSYSEKAYDHADKIRSFRKSGKERLKRFLPPLERAALEASKSMHYKAFTDNDEDLKPSKQMSLTKAEKQHMDPEALSKQRQLLMFRATLGDSFGNASGLNSAEEQDELMANVVAHECSKMHYPFTQLDECKLIYKTHLDLLSKIFRFFCGVSGAGGDQGAATMNHAEWIGFAQRCDLLGTSLEERQIVEEVFHEADSGLGEECGDVQHELLRHEFLEGLLRLAVAKYPETEEAEALEKIMDEHIVAHLSPLLDDPVKQLFGQSNTQMKFIDNAKKLLLVYNRYAAADGSDNASAGGRPTMNMHEFFELLGDAALMDSYSQADSDDEDHAIHAGESSGAGKVELTTKEARMAFAQAQGDTDEVAGELSELVYSEFLEAVIRIALAKWESDGIPNQVKIDLALKSITALARQSYK